MRGENMDIPVIVYGAGGLGREVMQIVIGALVGRGGYAALGYLDDGIAPGTVRGGFPVLGGGDYLENSVGELALVMGIADPDTKAGLYKKFKDRRGVSFPNVIHPGASVSASASLGRGVVIASGCFVSVDAVVGDCVFMSNGAFIGHDVRIGGFSSIMPLAAIAGCVAIGERCLIGMQCAIRQGSSVGNGAAVGMGGVVLGDVPDGETVAGNPAKRI